MKIKPRSQIRECYIPFMLHKFSLTGDGAVVYFHKPVRVYRDQIITTMWVDPAIKDAKFLKKMEQESGFKLDIRKIRLDSAMNKVAAELDGMVTALESGGLTFKPSGLKDIRRRLASRITAGIVFLKYALRQQIYIDKTIFDRWISVRDKAIVFWEQIDEMVLANATS